MNGSEQDFQNAVRFSKATIDMVANFLKSLIEFLEKNHEYEPYRKMLKWLKDAEGKNMPVQYTIKNKCHDEVKAELYKLGVPHILLTDGNILIRPEDVDIVREINREVNIAKGNYFQEVDAVEFENAIATFDKIKDKSIFELQNLNEYELEVLKNKINNISKGLMVGVKHKDTDHNNVLVQSSKVFDMDKTDRYTNDVCKAFLAMKFSLYGLNADTKIAQIDADKKMDEQIAALKGNPDTHYIVGADDSFKAQESEDRSKKYLEIDEHGFRFHVVTRGHINADEYDPLKEYQKGEAVMYNGNPYVAAKDGILAPPGTGLWVEDTAIVDDIPEGGSVSINDIDYELELQRFSDQILNKAIIEDKTILNNHLVADVRTITTDRPEKTLRQMDIATAEKLMIDKINKMIKAKAAAETYIPLDAQDAFSYYTDEASKILQAALNHKVPEGYKNRDIQELYGICKEKNVDFAHYGKFSKDIYAQTNCRNAKKQNKVEVKEIIYNKEKESRSDNGKFNR